MAKAANPFDGLLGITLGRTPKPAAKSVLVVNGQRVKTARDIRAADEVEAPDAEELRRELKRARNRARYQKDRQNPEAMAKRKAWYEANREKVKAYKKQWDAAHEEQLRASRQAWAKREYHADPVKHRQKQRDYYSRHREEILARLKAKRDAAKAAKAAAKGGAE